MSRDPRQLMGSASLARLVPEATPTPAETVLHVVNKRTRKTDTLAISGLKGKLKVGQKLTGMGLDGWTITKIVEGS